jgi:hypothetical protein
MINECDILKVIDYCRKKLDLANTLLGDEYYSQSLPLCVIDTVFSIAARYESTIKTVRRFCDYFGLKMRREQQPEYPSTSDQLSVSDFVKLYDKHTIEEFACKIYRNRQRTSTRNGILKSEAVLLFARVLRRFEVNYFQDIRKVIGNPEFEANIAEIPGQRSGISTRYFYMLVGSDDYIKPDRMVARFIRAAIQQTLSVETSHELIVGAQQVLAKDYLHLTPRLLDYLIWQYQRTEKTESGS